MDGSPAGKAKRILIADDDDGSIALLSTWLTKDGYEVDVATDGEQALHKAERNHPDLIFLDIMMPKLDGYSLLLRLKGNSLTTQIPVFIISGQSEKEHEDICRTFGALGFIKKPYRIAEVARKVALALA